MSIKIIYLSIKLSLNLYRNKMKKCELKSVKWLGFVPPDDHNESVNAKKYVLSIDWLTLFWTGRSTFILTAALAFFRQGNLSRPTLNHGARKSSMLELTFNYKLAWYHFQSRYLIYIYWQHKYRPTYEQLNTASIGLTLSSTSRPRSCRPIGLSFMSWTQTVYAYKCLFTNGCLSEQKCYEWFY